LIVAPRGSSAAFGEGQWTMDVPICHAADWGPRADVNQPRRASRGKCQPSQAVWVPDTLSSPTPVQALNYHADH